MYVGSVWCSNRVMSSREDQLGASTLMVYGLQIMSNCKLILMSQV